MLLDVLEQGIDNSVPVISGADFTVQNVLVVLFDKLNGIVLIHPFDKSINILKMIIKCLSVYPAGINYLMDLDLIERFFPHQIS